MLYFSIKENYIRFKKLSDVPHAVQSSIANEEEKQLLSPMKVQTMLHGHKVHKYVDKLQKIDFFSGEKKAQQSDILQNVRFKCVTLKDNL